MIDIYIVCRLSSELNEWELFEHGHLLVQVLLLIEYAVSSRALLMLIINSVDVWHFELMHCHDQINITRVDQ